MLIEHLSQFYRCIVPIVPWVAFLMDDQEGGQWFAIVLLIIYTLSKVRTRDFIINGFYLLYT